MDRLRLKGALIRVQLREVVESSSREKELASNWGIPKPRK